MSNDPGVNADDVLVYNSDGEQVTFGSLSENDQLIVVLDDEDSINDLVDQKMFSNNAARMSQKGIYSLQDE